MTINKPTRVQTIKELKEAVKDLPDGMRVEGPFDHFGVLLYAFQNILIVEEVSGDTNAPSSLNEE
jgi:hypothetical protein